MLNFVSVTLMPLVLQLWRHVVLHFDGLCGAHGSRHRVMGYILSGIHKEGNVVYAFLSLTLSLPPHIILCTLGTLSLLPLVLYVERWHDFGSIIYVGNRAHKCYMKLCFGPHRDHKW